MRVPQRRQATKNTAYVVDKIRETPLVLRGRSKYLLKFHMWVGVVTDLLENGRMGETRNQDKEKRTKAEP